MRLKGKIALVTAAGQGIGKAAVLAMVAEGATVYATDVNPDLLKSYEGVANVHTAVLNVLDKAAITAQVASLARVDIIFNCAGFVHNGNIELATDDDWVFAFNLNVRSQFWMIQAVIPKMVAQFAQTGQVNGIKEAVDLNVFVGDTAQLQTWIAESWTADPVSP